MTLDTWPNTYLPCLPVLTPFSMESALSGVGGNYNNAAASAVWPQANDAIYVPFHLETFITVTKLLTFNGATASGNIDVGIYTADGRRMISSGSTAQAGTNDLQVFDVTDTLLGPGDYYFAAAMDNATGTLFRIAPSQLNLLHRVGMASQVTAFALPATATFAVSTFAYIPVIGLLQGRTIL